MSYDEVTTRVSVYDSYNFDIDKSADLPLLGEVSDERVRRLVLAGLAKELRMDHPIMRQRSFERNARRVSLLTCVGLLLVALTGCGILVPTHRVTPTPASMALPTDSASLIAEDRLSRTGWWLPESVTDLTGVAVDASTVVNSAGGDIEVFEFTVLRSEIEAMLPSGQGTWMGLRESSELRPEHLNMLMGTQLPVNYHFIKSSNDKFNCDINVLILPDGEEDLVRVILLSYVFDT